MVLNITHQKHHQTMVPDAPTLPTPVPSGHGIRLPVEIWLEILSSATVSSIKAITLTCSTLRWLAQPLLFKILIVHVEHDAIDVSQDHRRDARPTIDSLRRLELLNLPHITNAVTEMRLVPSASSMSVPKPRDQGPPAPLSANTDGTVIVGRVFEALPSSLVNLQRLVCHDVVFGKDHLSALSRLPQLRDLELQSCITTCHSLDFPDFSLVPLESLIFDYPYNSQDYFRNPRFLALFLQSRKLKRVTVGPANDILFAITDIPPPDSLSSLQIPVSCVSSPLFAPMLASCPSVQELSLYMAIGNSHLPPLEYLPPDILPNLRSYHGPRTYAPWFTKNREITNVEFPLPAQPYDLCATLVGLAKQIESFSCKVDDLDGTLLKTIHTTFPTLKHLAISGGAIDIDRLASVLAIAKVHRGLTSIQINVQTGEPRLTDSWGAAVAKMFLSRLTRAYPFLQRAKLIYQPEVSVVWTRPREKRQPGTVIESSELRIERKAEATRTNAIWDMLRFKP